MGLRGTDRSLSAAGICLGDALARRSCRIERRGSGSLPESISQDWKFSRKEYVADLDLPHHRERGAQRAALVLPPPQARSGVGLGSARIAQLEGDYTGQWPD